MAGHQLDKRLDSGAISAICVGGVAVSIAFVCFLFGYVWPQWKEHRAASKHTSKYCDNSILTKRRRIKHYPSHPAIRPLLSKPEAAQILPTYNPRTESPFPDSPNFVQGFGNVPGRTNSAPEMLSSLSSNGLFTPTRSSSVERENMRNQYHTVPRAVKSKLIAGVSNEFGDAKEFILAVPEPLVFKSRAAGRHPVVARQLARNGSLPTSSPASSDIHLHPKKLFQTLERGDYRSSLCSSTTLRIEHRISDAAVAAQEMHDALDQAIQPGADKNTHRRSSEESKTNSLACQNESCAPLTHTTLHRLNSYRSLTGSEPRFLTRTGTIKRSKTPVAELSKMYDFSKEEEPAIPMIQLARKTIEIDEAAENRTLSDVGDVATEFGKSPQTSIVPFGVTIETQTKRNISEPLRAERLRLVNQGQLRIRVRASSLYSRDTHGYSLNTTPTTIDFPSPKIDASCGHEANGNPFRGRESVKDRVNQWNLRSGQENTSPLPLSPSWQQGEVEAMSSKEDDNNSDVVVCKGKAEKECVEAPGGARWI